MNALDALTAAAIESLAVEFLPRLQMKLDTLREAKAAGAADVDLRALVSEVIELLKIVDKWTNPVAAASMSEAMSDDEAKMLLADMDGAPAGASSLPAAAPAGDMSDDEARMLLADMDGAPASAAPAASISDDEAARLLAAMDEPAPAVAPLPVAAPTAAPTAPTPAHVDEHGHGEGGEDDGDVEEIPEWDSNQFASDPEMLKDFMTNSDDLMTQLDETVLQLEQDPTNKETIEAIFRAAHTLKGAAGMFGYRGIERVMHRMENLFDLVRKGKLVPNADTIDVVLQGLDMLKKLLEAVRNSKQSGLKTAPIVKALSLAAKGKSGKSALGQSIAPVAPAVASAAAPIATAEAKPADRSGAAAEAPKKKNEASSTIRVDIERLDALVNLVGELVTDRTRFVTIEEELRQSKTQLKAAGDMTEVVQLFGRHMNEIQDIIMKVRMVPIGNAFSKFPRVVRDLARQLGKQIDLVLEGESTELDKTLVEQIADPLVHLVRNACDHGIEMPEARVAAGKTPNGRVKLSAKQEGNSVIIMIQDEGKGMDVERIRSKAIEKGLIKAEDNLSERDIFNLIFEPGFSTAEKVTTVSGRGVGMDVVKKQISKLKGLVDITSKKDVGSTITIQLPLTLAIVQSLLVKSREETFAIPLSSVVETLRIKPTDIQRVGDSEVIRNRDAVLPLIHLDGALSLQKKVSGLWYRKESAPGAAADRRNQRRSERLFIVVVGSAERRFGIVVDQLMNQQEMVIKPMGAMMKDIPCTAGGAVLGNGEVVLVLDIQELEAQFRSQARQNAA